MDKIQRKEFFQIFFTINLFFIYLFFFHFLPTGPFRVENVLKCRRVDATKMPRSDLVLWIAWMLRDLNLRVHTRFLVLCIPDLIFVLLYYIIRGNKEKPSWQFNCEFTLINWIIIFIEYFIYRPTVYGNNHDCRDHIVWFIQEQMEFICLKLRHYQGTENIHLWRII